MGYYASALLMVSFLPISLSAVYLWCCMRDALQWRLHIQPLLLHDVSSAAGDLFTAAFCQLHTSSYERKLLEVMRPLFLRDEQHMEHNLAVLQRYIVNLRQFESCEFLNVLSIGFWCHYVGGGAQGEQCKVARLGHSFQALLLRLRG